MQDFNNIKEYHHQLLQLKVSCAATVTAYLDKIEANKHLNAFVDVYAAEALQKAQELDLKRKNGEPLKKPLIRKGQDAEASFVLVF